MATAKEIAQQPIDLSSADAAGTPLVSTDATHVDASTTPTTVASSATAGTSLLASPANHKHKRGPGERLYVARACT